MTTLSESNYFNFFVEKMKSLHLLYDANLHTWAGHCSGTVRRTNKQIKKRVNGSVTYLIKMIKTGKRSRTLDFTTQNPKFVVLTTRPQLAWGHYYIMTTSA